jgi:hypothetical protein
VYIYKVRTHSVLATYDVCCAGHALFGASTTTIYTAQLGQWPQGSLVWQLYGRHSADMALLGVTLDLHLTVSV